MEVKKFTEPLKKACKKPEFSFWGGIFLLAVTLPKRYVTHYKYFLINFDPLWYRFDVFIWWVFDTFGFSLTIFWSFFARVWSNQGFDQHLILFDNPYLGSKRGSKKEQNFDSFWFYLIHILDVFFWLNIDSVWLRFLIDSFDLFFCYDLIDSFDCFFLLPPLLPIDQFFLLKLDAYVCSSLTPSSLLYFASYWCLHWMDFWSSLFDILCSLLFDICFCLILIMCMLYFTPEVLYI